jgi:hypothetical protein
MKGPGIPGGALLAALLALATSAAAETPGRFAFAVIGDTPYHFLEEMQFTHVLGALNREQLAFVVHVGDLKGGHSPCGDALFEERKGWFAFSRHPLVFVPGDNDWLDCRREAAGSYDPQERLSRLRELFFAGGASLGREAMPVARQASDPRFPAFRENQRWRRGPYLFATLNIPGGNNNRGGGAEPSDEHRARMQANHAWMAEAFRIAKRENASALFLIFHANPGWERAAQRPRDGYREFRAQLAKSARAFGRPVVAVHGDTHTFRADRPLRDPAGGAAVPNLIRIESYGSPAMGWVRVELDPGARDWIRIQGRPFPPQE